MSCNRYGVENNKEYENERIEEITHLIDAFEDGKLRVSLSGLKAREEVLVSDFKFLLSLVKEQQDQIDTLSMAHDSTYRLLDKDKHALIKSNITLNNRANNFEESLARKRKVLTRQEELSRKENSRLYDQINKLEEENYTLRDAVRSAANVMWHYSDTFEDLREEEQRLMTVLEGGE